VIDPHVIDSNAMFAAAIDDLNVLNPQPDLVLLSGDLVNMGEGGIGAATQALPYWACWRGSFPAIMTNANHFARAFAMTSICRRRSLLMMSSRGVGTSGVRASSGRYICFAFDSFAVCNFPVFQALSTAMR